ncbi:hypothetical protein [Halobaculum magnesiiphilum]|uniref:Uncharacterized protein n=1 Tax=Halobaculum magnesiiphilum TaxID=1017351 RepID=A0A8T8WEX3_9EURY|nr:hypothetical protein [Halobaculum magnesiiphilum]QZP38284.1 hypothetical protein K6T50_03815 [Halobaculum magnesiiphilum]
MIASKFGEELHHGVPGRSLFTRALERLTAVCGIVTEPVRDELRTKNRWVGVITIPIAISIVVAVVGAVWAFVDPTSPIQYLPGTLHPLIRSALWTFPLFGGRVIGVLAVVTVLFVIGGIIVLIPSMTRGMTSESTARSTVVKTDSGVEATIGADGDIDVDAVVDKSLGRDVDSGPSTHATLHAAATDACGKASDTLTLCTGYITVAAESPGSIIVPEATSQDDLNQIPGERLVRTLRRSSVPYAGVEFRLVPVDIPLFRLRQLEKRDSAHPETSDIVEHAETATGQFQATAVGFTVGHKSAGTDALTSALGDIKAYIDRTPGLKATIHINSQSVGSARRSPPAVLSPNCVWDGSRSIVKQDISLPGPFGNPLREKRTPIVLPGGVIDFVASETDANAGALGQTDRESQFSNDDDDLDDMFKGDD